MAFIKVGFIGDVPPGSAIHVEIGDGAVAVCNVEGTLHAIDGICPHSGGPLGYGSLQGKMLVCPFHAWEFDCTTGQFDMDGDLKQATYPVKIENEEILVDLGRDAA